MVADITVARAELADRGVEVSDVHSGQLAYGRGGAASGSAGQGSSCDLGPAARREPTNARAEPRELVVHGRTVFEAAQHCVGWNG